MTEQEWLDSTDLKAMLAQLRRLKPRKLVRLTAVTVRACWDRLTQDAKEDLKSLEGYVEGRVQRDEVSGYGSDLDQPKSQLRRIVAWSVDHHSDRSAQQAALWRCVVGNPFRPCRLDPAWLAWEGGMIPKLAGAIYNQRRWNRLPILADALEEAGAPAVLVEHCRDEGPHTRGCWALELLVDRG